MDTSRLAAFGGQRDDGDIGFQAKNLADIHSIHAGQNQVQYDQVQFEGKDVFNRIMRRHQLGERG